jgi:hypothetical protein
VAVVTGADTAGDDDIPLVFFAVVPDALMGDIFHDERLAGPVADPDDGEIQPPIFGADRWSF